MENNLTKSIFQTHQLSRYREWSIDKYSCLFYVADSPAEDERARGAVYLIDSSFRKGDKVGEYDKLHRSEIDALSNTQPVLKGFAAFLFTQDCNKWLENREILHTWWKLYYEWCLEARPRSGFETEYILQECRNWTARIEDVIERHLSDRAKISLFRSALLYVIKDVFCRNTDSVYDQMKKWHPYISVRSSKSNSVEHIQFDYSVNAMKRGDKAFVYGIQAGILQYSAIQYAMQEIGRLQSLDRMVELLMSECGNVLSVEKIKIPEYNKDFAETLYEFTLKRSREIYERTYKLDMSSFMLSEKEIELGFISKLCELELNRSRKKELDSYMSAENIQNMRSLVKGYLVYLFEHMNGYKYISNLFAELETEFPELRKNNQCAKKQNLSEPFKFLTRKCYDENKIQFVENELKQAISESDPAIWDCLFRNIDLGYIENLDPIKSPQILEAIEERFGETGRSPRNFNIARTKAKFQRF